jgi:hypothetical protein
MQFLSLIALATLAIASPMEKRQIAQGICTGLQSNPVCCAADVLNLADVNCASRKFQSFVPQLS